MEIPAEAKRSAPRLYQPLPIAEWKLEPEFACPIPRRLVFRWGGMEELVLLVICLALSVVVLWRTELSFSGIYGAG